MSASQQQPVQPQTVEPVVVSATAAVAEQPAGAIDSGLSSP
jgi:hypothetical protein